VLESEGSLLQRAAVEVGAGTNLLHSMEVLAADLQERQAALAEWQEFLSRPSVER
jgi:hypothetical protein